MKAIIIKETYLMGYSFYIWKSFSLSVLAAGFEWLISLINHDKYKGLSTHFL